IGDAVMSGTAHEQATIEPPVMARTTSVTHFADHSDPRKPVTGARSSSDAAIVRTISGIMKTASDQVISRLLEERPRRCEVPPTHRRDHLGHPLLRPCQETIWGVRGPNPSGSSLS